MIKELNHDEEFLAQVAEPATAEDADVAQDLVDTLLSIKDECAGLAANMIGVNKAIICFFSTSDKVVVMYNPRITWKTGLYKAQEGCMSLERETVCNRYRRIKVVYQELVDGELVECEKTYRDWLAEVIQHEVDHCKGVLV